MYGTPGGVIDLTGVTPDQLGKATQDELEALLTRWLQDAQSMIDAFLERDLEEEVAAGQLAAIPSLVVSAAERIAANMVALAHQRRLGPVIQESEFSVQLSSDSVFTKAIRDDLAPLHRSKKRRQPMISLAGFPDTQV